MGCIIMVGSIFPGWRCHRRKHTGFFYFFCLFLSLHNRWMLKDMNYHFFSSLHYIFPSCAYVQVMYVLISIIESILLSCLLYRHFAIGDHYAPKHNLFNIVMLNSLAIYSNLKLLINFSIHIKTPSEHGNVTKAIIKHFRLKLNVYIKIFQREDHLIHRKMLTNSFYFKNNMQVSEQKKSLYLVTCK